MRSASFIYMFLLIQATILSQPCLPEGITFSTQVQIDSFQVNYPGCTEILGDIKIEDDVSNLLGLNVLTRIHGSLEIYTTYNLTSLEGLNNVTFIGGNLQIMDVISLSSLSGLENIDTVQGLIFIGGAEAGLPLLNNLSGLNSLNFVGGSLEFNRTSITDFTGLENLNYVGGKMFIAENDSLENLMGLHNLSSVNGLVITLNYMLSDLSGLHSSLNINGGVIISSNYSLVNLCGLEGITSIEGDLKIRHNASLNSLMGLENVISVDGSLHISGNDMLISLVGLENINAESIADLAIENNISLSQCEVQSICDYLVSPNGTIWVYGNDAGCNSPVEIAVACGIKLPCLPYGNYCFLTQNQINEFQSDYPSCTQLEGLVLINGDDINNLDSLNIVTSINDFSIFSNPILNDIWGLKNLDSIKTHFTLYGNSILDNLNDLEGLMTIGGYLTIKHNDSLADLHGLENIDAESISDLVITNNYSLSTCHVQSICDYLASPNGTIEIFENAPGCNSPEEVQDSCEANSVSIEERYILEECKVSPNPFATSTTFEYTLERPENVHITIYSVQGQIVGRMQLKQDKGVQSVEWNAEGLPAGMYYFRVQAGSFFGSGKMIKMK